MRIATAREARSFPQIQLAMLLFEKIWTLSLNNIGYHGFCNSKTAGPAKAKLPFQLDPATVQEIVNQIGAFLKGARAVVDDPKAVDVNIMVRAVAFVRPRSASQPQAASVCCESGAASSVAAGRGAQPDPDVGIRRPAVCAQLGRAAPG